MTRAIACVVAAALAVVAAPAAQQPPPSAAKPVAGAPGIIRGRITAADTGRPLRRATVSLRPDTAQPGRPILSVSTNSQGIFEMRDVNPGSYFVSAARAGYIEIQHGQRRPQERGLAIELRSGETRDRIDIALPRGSVLAGRVADELGTPYPGVTVLALVLRYQQGQRMPFPGGSAVTDDQGHYRIAGLQPGFYQVMASSSETWRNEKGETFGYGATFFPGTLLPQSAQTIALSVSQQRVDLDLALAASRTARIRGRVHRPTGEPLGGEQVGLSRSIGTGVLTAGATSTRTASDGTFEFRDVPPATYSVRASGTGIGSAGAILPVNGVDIDGVVLVPRTGSNVIGTVVTDEGTTPPLPPSSIRFNLVAPPGAEVLPSVRVFGIENDWTIRMTSVGGPFVFRAIGLPDTWMIDRVRVGERDVTDEPFLVPPGGANIQDFQIVLTNKVGTINGSVVNADGRPTRDATIVVFADDAGLWTVASRFVRSTRPTTDGRFSITGLPAGDYLVVVREFVTEGEWESREFLEAARQDAVRVTLQRGGTELVALKLR